MLCMDVRMALSSLITLPLGFPIMKPMFRGSGERYAKFMKAGDNLNKIVVEYLDGIEVIKVFNQAGSTFEKMKQAVTYFKMCIRDRENTIRPENLVLGKSRCGDDSLQRLKLNGKD